MYVHIHVHIPR